VRGQNDSIGLKPNTCDAELASGTGECVISNIDIGQVRTAQHQKRNPVVVCELVVNGEGKPVSIKLLEVGCAVY